MEFSVFKRLYATGQVSFHLVEKLASFGSDCAHTVLDIIFFSHDNVPFDHPKWI